MVIDVLMSTTGSGEEEDIWMVGLARVGSCLMMEDMLRKLIPCQRRSRLIVVLLGRSALTLSTEQISEEYCRA